ncbi:hypothetical protein SDC9_153749 [bioreactor metagenome]|uniref:Uncharacterized protein n=1 Tax=bioreactor metagenome TaxID=1076179 RepID=A0A645F1G3_9ZZZZ
MCTIGYSAQSSHRLTLGACTHDQHFIRWKAVQFARVDEQVIRSHDESQFSGRAEVRLHTASEYCDFPARFERDFSDLLQSVDIGREGSKNDSSRNFLDDVFKGLANNLL